MAHSAVFVSPNEDSPLMQQQHQPFVTSPATPPCASHSSSVSGDLPQPIAQNGFTTEASGIPQSVKGAPEHLRTVIRKRQNSESARRSRQRKKVANQAFYERFDSQCKRLKALEEKVAQLAELVRRKRLREAQAEAEAEGEYGAPSEADEESEGAASAMQLDPHHNNDDDDDFITHPSCIPCPPSMLAHEDIDSSDDSPPPEGLYVLNDSDSPVDEHFATDCSKSETLEWRSNTNPPAIPSTSTLTTIPTAAAAGPSTMPSTTPHAPSPTPSVMRSSFTATTRYGPASNANVNMGMGATITAGADLGVGGIASGNAGAGLTPTHHSHSRVMPPFMLSGCRGMERVRISTDHPGDSAEGLLLGSQNVNSINSNRNSNHNGIGGGAEIRSEAPLVQSVPDVMSVPVSVPVVATDMSLSGDTGHGFSFDNELELLDPVMTAQPHLYSPCLS